MFCRLVKVVIMPLGSLFDGQKSFHSNNVVRNVRKILENGGSIPLVFPRYELGFEYNINHTLMQERRLQMIVLVITPSFERDIDFLTFK